MYINRMSPHPGTAHAPRAQAALPVTCALLVLAAGAGCTSPSRPGAPPADALVITADSSYWVTSDRKGLRIRGEPILITRLDGRFREIYVADDDRSYFDAVFVGQRMFVRDLVRGDSTELFADSVVPRLARTYAASHPREAPLAEDEDASADPHTTATADLEILDVHPPWVSYEYHTDVGVNAERGALDRHSARRGVLDLRTGRGATVSQLFGAAAAERAVAEASAEWDAARDSILERRGDRAARAQRQLGQLAFDATSFSLDAHDREPAVVFAVPAVARKGATPPLALTARPVAAPPWWAGQSADLPAGPDSARSWARGALEIVARAAVDPDRATLVLRDAAQHEWPLGTVTAPVQRVLWLDATVTAEARRALHKAFNESSQASEDTRIASAGTRQQAPRHGAAEAGRARPDPVSFTRPVSRVAPGGRLRPARFVRVRRSPRP